MRIQPSLTPQIDRREFLGVAIASGLALSCRSEVNGAIESPPDSWTTFRNGPQLLGVAGSELPERPELLWEVPAVDGVVSTPAIVDDITYVGCLGGDLLALEVKTGKEIWKYRSIESSDPKEFAPGFAAPIAVSSELVFAGDDSGIFHAVERSNGKARWRFTTEAEIIGGPTLTGDRVIFGSHDGNLYCLNQKDGSKVWEVATQGPVNGTPSLSGSYTFITGCDKPVMRIIDVEKGAQHAEAPLAKLLIASAAVVGETLYFGTDGGSVVAYDWMQKKPVWTYSVSGREQQIQSSPAILGDVVVIGSRDKHLHAINRTTGDAIWTFPTRAKIDGSPVIAGDRIYFGSADKLIYGVTLKDGKEVWKFPAGQSVVGSAAVAGGRMVIGTETSSGRILCFGAK